MKNPGIKLIRGLRNRRQRDDSGLSIIEGFRTISRALECGIEMRICYYAPELFLGKNEVSLLEKVQKSGTVLQEVSAGVLAKISYRDRPEGLIALIPVRKHELSGMPTGENSLYLIAEGIEKPGNLGSILRSADAVGASGVLICEKCTDIYNPNVITASTGALFSMNIAEDSRENVLAWLQQHRIKTVAATPEAAKNYTEVDYSASTAVIVGAEQYGVSRFWKKHADQNAFIPMLGYIDSLNVATAATVILYEAVRQRRNA